MFYIPFNGIKSQWIFRCRKSQEGKIGPFVHQVDIPSLLSFNNPLQFLLLPPRMPPAPESSAREGYTSVTIIMLDKVTSQFWIKSYHMIPKPLQASRSDFFTRLPISTSALNSLNTAASPVAEALDFRFIQDLGDKGNLGALLAGFTGLGWEKEKQVLFSTFTSQGFHLMLMNQSNPDGSSLSSISSENSSPEPQIDCGMGLKMLEQASATARLFSSHRRALLSLILLPPTSPASIPKVDKALSSLLAASGGLKDTMTIVTARSSTSPLLPLPFFLVVPRQVCLHPRTWQK